jgi:hypothetical protein
MFCLSDVRRVFNNQFPASSCQFPVKFRLDAPVELLKFQSFNMQILEPGDWDRELSVSRRDGKPGGAVALPNGLAALSDGPGLPAGAAADIYDRSS